LLPVVLEAGQELVYTCSPALRRMRQGDPKFKANLGYMARPLLKKLRTLRTVTVF
jgi:hypothetical protein